MGTCGGVPVSVVDEAVGVRNCRVVEEEIDVIRGGQQRADVAFEDEVGLHGAFDRIFDLCVCSPDEVSQITADLLLPGWERRM